LEICLKPLFWEFIGSLATLGRCQACLITVATEIFGGKFWQPDGVSALRFIYMRSTPATDVNDITPSVATVIHIYIASFWSNTQIIILCAPNYFFICNVLWISCIVEVFKILELIYYFLYVKWISSLLLKLISNWTACAYNKIPKIA
jgi:hypothetical protein